MRSLDRSPVGHLIAITGHDARFGEDYEAEAFIPDDLPSEVSLPNSAWAAASDAALDLGRLDAAASFVARPDVIVRVAMRREAIGTSALEGTSADLDDLLAAEVTSVGGRASAVSPDVREVMNYTVAAEHAFAWVRDRPITLGLISALQAAIVRDTVSDGPDAGAIRTTQVFIGAQDRRVGDARFVPPPPGDALRAMCERWVGWIGDPTLHDRIPRIARVAMAHYQFEALHPFTDGNGRLGRLIVVLQLLREGALGAPVLAVSPWLEDRAEEYRDRLLAVSETGDWAPWIEFFATAISAEAQAGLDRIRRLLALREEIVDAVRTARPRARLAIEIADDLIANPILSVADAHRRYGRTNQANRDAIGLLVELGVLEPYRDAPYDRLFWSPRVFAAIR